jgi:hypothetical protein
MVEDQVKQSFTVPCSILNMTGHLLLNVKIHGELFVIVTKHS